MMSYVCPNGEPHPPHSNPVYSCRGVPPKIIREILDAEKPVYHRPPQRISDNRAMHSYPIWAQEENCRCGQPAAHKVEETSDTGIFHPLTAYVCCEHFRQLVGDCSRYPYDEPKAR